MTETNIAWPDKGTSLAWPDKGASTKVSILDQSIQVLTVTNQLVDRIEALRDKIRGVDGLSPIVKEPESKGLYNTLETSIRKLNEALRLTEELNGMF